MVTTNDFPQADRLTQVGNVAVAVSKGNTTDEAIESFIGLASDRRQGRYYRRAAEILGLIYNHNNHSVLTALGQEYASLSSEASKKEFLARCVIETEVFSVALRYIRENAPTESQLNAWFYRYYPGERSTAERRRSTFHAYLKETNLISYRANRLRARLVTVAVERENKTIQAGLGGKPINREFLQAPTRGVNSVLNIEIDCQKREKASQIHWNLITAKTRFLKGRNFPAEENKLIDLFSSSRNDQIIYEMKSLSDKNFSSQIRHAVSQLYEYRFIFSSPDARLCIVTNASVPKTDKWVLDYLLRDRLIAYEWTEDFQTFECADASKSLLSVFAP